MMVNGRCIFNFLNAQEQFWHWGMTDINIDDKFIEFKSLRDQTKSSIRIEFEVDGFKVRLFRPGIMKKRKVAKTYKKVNPSVLSDLITEIIFHQDSVAA